MDLLMWLQETFQLASRRRGFHLITDDILKHLPEINAINIGVLHVFIQHTSASLTINENADPTVRSDFESFINKLVPENEPYFEHTLEGSDDLPAHIKASLLGNSITVPISNGQLALGVWQGIYLGEHRNHGGKRTLVATIHGE